MNALDHLIADIKAAHKGEKLPRRPAACPQGQAPRPRPAQRQTAAKPAPKPATPVAQPVADESPAIARALATLRAEFARIGK